MAYTEQFIVFGKKAAFDASFSAGEVKATSIVFIEDTKQIWTQGTLYSCPFTAVEIQEFLESKVDKITGKSLVADDLITKLTALKAQTEITSDINAVKTTVDNYTVNGKKISTNPVLAKEDVGLENVTNDAQVKRSEMGVADGIATLDAEGKVPVSQLPLATEENAGVMSAADKTVLSSYKSMQNGLKDILQRDPSSEHFIVGPYLTATPDDSRIEIALIGNILDITEDSNGGISFQDSGSNDSIIYIDEATADRAGLMTAEQVRYSDVSKALVDGLATLSNTAEYDPSIIINGEIVVKEDSNDGDGMKVGFKYDSIGFTSEPGKLPQLDEIQSGHVNEVTLPAATSTRNGIMSAKDKAILDSFKNINHIPEGGHERQILSWESDGKAKWDDMSNLFTGLEELLAYGVEWDVTVADPHLTRIGNMSLHKTLPIQSQLKGCIAQNDKVIYWLDENDWNAKSGTVVVAKGWSYSDTISTMFPSAKIGDVIKGDFQYTEGEQVYTINLVKEIDDLSLCLEDIIPGFSLSWDIDAISDLKIYTPSRLDGYDGTVRVYCPAFYIKSKSIGNKRQVWLSTVKIDNTWTYQPEILIDAYRSTVLNTVPENMGYLSTLPVNSAISVVNTATYCRGGGNASTYDQYLETDPCRTGLGKPRTTGLNRATMRQYAKNAGNYIMSYDQYKNIMYWLYVVEYANFNSQEAFNSALTDEGYHQGGMGPGVTTINGNYWSYYNGYTPLTPCGYLNEIGNGSGIKAMTFVTPTVSGGEPAQSYTVQVPRWRGFDNPFGDIWTNLDGIIIDADADNHPNNMNYVYTCKDPDKFGETLTEDWEKIGEEIHQDGYTKLFDLGDAAHIIPKVMGGNTTTYKCDYHWTGVKNATLRALLAGGRASNGAAAGLGDFDSGSTVSHSWAYVGFRSVSRFLSFSSQE